jgi:hypothetical protein
MGSAALPGARGAGRRALVRASEGAAGRLRAVPRRRERATDGLREDVEVAKDTRHSPSRVGTLSDSEAKPGCRMGRSKGDDE